MKGETERAALPSEATARDRRLAPWRRPGPDLVRLLERRLREALAHACCAEHALRALALAAQELAAGGSPGLSLERRVELDRRAAATARSLTLPATTTDAYLYLAAGVLLAAGELSLDGPANSCRYPEHVRPGKAREEEAPCR